MKKTVLSFLFMNLIMSSVFSAELSFKFAKDISTKDKKILIKALNEVSSLLPDKMKLLMPLNIEIKVKQLSSDLKIPNNICQSSDISVTRADKKIIPFIYGLYHHSKKQLVINTPVLLELEKGRLNSQIINCQHKNLYAQSIATIVHELSHAYDLNNKRISNNSEYIKRAGFKRGLLKLKNKNLSAMRSADLYEMKNVAESFAVNMEYFVMDPEFYCRKPSMYNFFSLHFGKDPYPQRNCKVNDTVMVSSPHGYETVKLSLNRLYRIDYLIATPGKELSSGFGHSMFRLIMCAPERVDPVSGAVIPATTYGPKCLDDKLFHLVISYRANIEDSKLNYLKGLGVMGAYPSMLFILNFSDVLNEYNRDELRDVSSYPLILSLKQKEAFLLKTKEDHWNYRGAYKFITNNGAVESYNLLKSSLDENLLESKSSLSPNGVLKDLDKLEYISLSDKNIEIFKAKTDQLVAAYNSVYRTNLQNNKESKKRILKFINESTINQRMNQFNLFLKTGLPNVELNAELTLLKEKLIKASSFSVLEQQIQRTVALEVRKKAAEILSNSKEPRVLEMVKESRLIFTQNFETLTSLGYGIPFTNEMITSKDLDESSDSANDVLTRADQLLKEFLPNDYKKLEEIENSIKTFNRYSLNLRREFRIKLDQYIYLVLMNLARVESTRIILENAAKNDSASLKRVRNLLGEDLVGEKELLDLKLRKIIQEIL